MNKFKELRQAVTDRLERPSQTEAWDVPLGIRIEAGSIAYDPDGSAKQIREQSGLLEGFVELRESDEATIVKYARRWGVLGLCKHNLPIDHPELWPLAGASWGRQKTSPFLGLIPEGLNVDLSDPSLGVCRPEENQYGEHVESLAAWRSYAKIAGELLERAATLHRGRAKRSETESAWREIALVLGDWLFLAPMQIGCIVERGRLTTRLQPVHPFCELSAVLATQTLFAASRSSGLAICFGCGRLYLASRRIEEGRRNYCPDCGRRAAVRDAVARLRLRHRVVELSEQGMSERKITRDTGLDLAEVKKILGGKPRGKK